MESIGLTLRLFIRMGYNSVLGVLGKLHIRNWVRVLRKRSDFKNCEFWVPYMKKEVNDIMRFGEILDIGEKPDENIEQSNDILEKKDNDFEEDYNNKWNDTDNPEENDVPESDQDVKKISCINENLEGTKHPETGVPYERKIVEVDGKKVEGVFPQFKSEYDAKLPEELYKESDFKQFSNCTEQLKEAIQKDPELAKKFNDRQYEQIMDGSPRISGYTWHHTENPGEMQLVDADVHDATRHTGGRNIWGGGTENR